MVVLPVLAGGALFVVANRAAQGKFELSEERRDRLDRLRKLMEFSRHLLGNVSPSHPGSWVGFMERALDVVIDANRRYEKPVQARKALGMTRCLPLPAFVIQRLVEECPRERLFEADDSFVDLLAPCPGILLALESASSKPDEAKLYADRADFDRLEELYAAIAGVFWDGRAAVLLEVDRETLSARGHDLAAFCYRGNQLELIDRWRAFMEQGIRRNVLLQGRPGCGKSTFAAHAARELSRRTLVMRVSVLSELDSAQWFSMLDVLRPQALVIDDVDRSERLRRKSLDDMLSFFEESQCDVPLVLFTSNEHTRLPEALRRPGRIDQIIRFEEPEEQVQREIIEELAARVGVEVPPAQWRRLLRLLDEYSAAHVQEALRRGKVQGWQASRQEDVTFLLHRNFDSDHDWLRAHGFTELNTEAEFVLAELFERARPQIVFADEHDRLLGVELPNGAQLVMPMDSRGGLRRRASTWYFREEIDGLAALHTGLAELFWHDREAALLDEVTRGEYSLRTIDLQGPHYYGPLLELLERWECFYAQGFRRSVLLQGPPGCGKSTFCLHAARELSARTLVMTCTFFESISCGAWSQLIELLRPEMIIVDDVDRISEREMSSRLRLVEEGYCEVPYLLFTSNDHERLPQAMRRPGRIDEIHEVREPDETLRDRLIEQMAAREGVEIPLQHMQTLRKIVEAQSTAHLVECLRRARICGWEEITTVWDVTFGQDGLPLDEDFEEELAALDDAYYSGEIPF